MTTFRNSWSVPYSQVKLFASFDRLEVPKRRQTTSSTHRVKNPRNNKYYLDRMKTGTRYQIQSAEPLFYYGTFWYYTPQVFRAVYLLHVFQIKTLCALTIFPVRVTRSVHLTLLRILSEAAHIFIPSLRDLFCHNDTYAHYVFKYSLQHTVFSTVFSTLS